MDRRTFLYASSALVLSGCATKPRGVYEITEVPAPVRRVGQQWVYKRTDGYNGLPRGTLTRKVQSIDSSGMLITIRDERGRALDDAMFNAPGIQLSGTLTEDGPMTGRFSSPWRRYDFPLVANKRWADNFYLQRTDLGGTRNYINVSTRAEGWESVEAAGKTWKALVLSRFFNLGQKDFWSGNMSRSEVEWYAPEVQGPVRLIVTEEYFTRPGQVVGIPDNGNRFNYVLESFSLG